MDPDATDQAMVGVPTDLRNALETDPSALDAWRDLSPSDRQAHVDSLASGSNATARERCVRQLVAELAIQVPGHGGR